MLAALKKANCPGLERLSTSGKDLDWLFKDQETSHFLDHLSEMILNNDVILSDEDLAFLERNPFEDLLSVEQVQQILDDEEGQRGRGEDEDDLVLDEAAKDDLKKVEKNLQKAKTRQNARISALTQRVQESKVKLNKAVEKLIFSSGKKVENLEEIRTNISGILKNLELNFGFDDEELDEFLSHQKAKLDRIDDLAEKMLADRQINSDEDLAFEVERLKIGIKNAKMRQIIHDAQISAFEAQKSKIVPLKSEEEENGDEKSLHKIKTQLEPDLDEILTKVEILSDKFAEIQISKFNLIQVENEIARKKSLFECVDEIEKLALNQRSEQEFVDEAMKRDLRYLETLHESFNGLKTELETEKRKIDAQIDYLRKMRQFESEENDSDLIKEDDLVMRTLMKLCGSENYSKKYLTEHEVKEFLERKFLDKVKETEDEKDCKERELFQREIKLRRDLSELMRLLNIQSGKERSLRNPRLAKMLQDLEKVTKEDQKMLSESVLKPWAKAQSRSKGHLEMQRNLWIDFLIRPKLLVANVESIEKKAQAFAAADK